MAENKNAKTPADDTAGRGVLGNRIYTVTCISRKPPKQWVGLTDEDYKELSKIAFVEVIEKIELVLKEKNA